MSTTSPEGIYACSTVVPALSIVAVVLRFHTRMRAKVGLQFDDWAQIPALFLFVGMAVSALIGVANGAFGYTDPPLPPTTTAPSTILCSKLLYAIQILQIPALALIKCAAFYFYSRIFCPHRRSTLSYLLWGLISLTTVWAVAFIIAYVTACGTHPAAAWESQMSYLQYCIRSLQFEEAYAISDFILDVIVLILPLPLIWSLQMMSTGRKIGISCVFMLALVGLGASAARLAVYVEIANGSMGKKSVDVQSQDTQAVWFSMLETGFSLIAINLPCLGWLISRVPVESALRTVRSLLTIRSRSSNASSHRYAGFEGRPVKHKASFGSSQDLGLVPQRLPAEVTTTVASSEAAEENMEGRWDGDLESGIRVKKSLDQTEMRISDE